MMILTIDDLQYRQQVEIEREFQDVCCGKVSARWKVGKYWRGWIVTCECGEIVAELEGE